MQIKNIVFAVLAATAVATTASEQPNALRRDVTADAVQEATVDMAGTTVRIADKVIDELANKVIDGLANLDDIASSTIDIAQDLFDLNVAKIVPDGIKLAQLFAQEVSIFISFFSFSGSGGSNSGGFFGNIFGGGKKPSDNDDDEQKPFSDDDQLKICKLLHDFTKTQGKFFDLFTGKAGVLRKIPIVSQTIIPVLKKFEDAINGFAGKIINFVPLCAEQAKKDLEELNGKLTDAESALAFTYQYTYSNIQPKRTAAPEA